MHFWKKIIYSDTKGELPEDLAYIIRIVSSLDLVLMIWSAFLAAIVWNASHRISLIIGLSVVLFFVSLLLARNSNYLLARLITSFVLPFQAIIFAILLKGSGGDILGAKVFLSSMVWIPLIFYRKNESYYIWFFLSFYLLIFFMLKFLPSLEIQTSYKLISNLLLYASFALFGLMAFIYRVQVNKYMGHYEQYSIQLESAMEQLRDLYSQYQQKEEDLTKVNRLLKILNDRLAAKNKEILKNNQLLQVITFNIQELIFLLDEKNSIVFYNNPALNVLGYNGEEITPGKLQKILKIELDTLWSLAEHEKRIPELKVKRRNGKYVYLSLWAQTIVIEDEKMLLLTLFNITEQKINDIIIRRQYKKLLQYSRDLHQSLVYAKRIQKAVVHFDLIPRLLSFYFSEHFIFLRPKNLVSGDFYFVKNLPNSLVFAVGDCTGHGVPGAFMTIISIAILNEITYRYSENTVDKMLQMMRLKLNEALATEKTYIMDSVDIALCKYSAKTGKLEYAGINIPIYIVNSGNLQVIEPTKVQQNRYTFEYKCNRYETSLRDGDVIYIATDGFRDQFGGTKNKKYKRRRFLDLLVKISQLPLDEQKKELQEEFAAWKGKHEQTDDILVMGLKK